MNEQPKPKFYKRWWFAFVLGAVAGPVLLIGVLFLVAYPQYLTPKYWIEQATSDVSSGKMSKDGLSDLARPTATTTPAYFELREQDANGNYVPTGFDNRYLVAANLVSDGVAQPPRIEMQFNEQGGKLLEAITARNAGKPVGFFVNGELIMAPVVQGKISAQSLALVGNFTLQQAANLARGLNAGKGLTQSPQ